MAGIVQIDSIVGNGLSVIAQSVVGLASPEVGLVAGFLLVSTQLNRLVEAVDCLLHLLVGKGLRTQLEENVLLRLQNLSARLLDLLDRVEGGLIVLGGHVGLHQVIVHLVRIGGVREVIQEVLENRDRLTKAREVGLMDQQGIIVHRCLLHLLIKRGRSGRFKRHAGIVLILQFQIALTQIHVSVLCQGIVRADCLAQLIDRFGILALVEVANTQQVEVAT